MKKNVFVLCLLIVLVNCNRKDSIVETEIDESDYEPTLSECFPDSEDCSASAYLALRKQILRDSIFILDDSITKHINENRVVGFKKDLYKLAYFYSELYGFYDDTTCSCTGGGPDCSYTTMKNIVNYYNTHIHFFDEIITPNILDNLLIFYPNLDIKPIKHSDYYMSRNDTI